MENILFYGDRDDASRRQVRSAAAQHSHRIGPRKPKSSKKSRTEIGSPKKRPLKTNVFAALGPADLAPKERPSTGSSNSNSSTPPSTARFDLPAAALTANRDGSPGFASTPVDLVRETSRQQKPQTFRWKEVHGNDRPPGSDQHRLSRPPSDVPVPSYGNASSVAPPAAPPRGQASLPPALVIERIPQSIPTSASHSRQSSGASTVSPSTRLPQYSWTEYPRYGLSHGGIQTSLQAMPQVDKDSPDRRLAPVPSGAVSSPGLPAVLSSSVPLRPREVATDPSAPSRSVPASAPAAAVMPAMGSSTIPAPTSVPAQSVPGASAQPSSTPWHRSPASQMTTCSEFRQSGEPSRTTESRELPRLGPTHPGSGAANEGAHPSSFADFLRSTTHGNQYIDDIDRRRSPGGEQLVDGVKREEPPHV